MDITFDLKNITARQMNTFLRAVSVNDLEVIADTLTLVVVECPAQWGDPKNPETYLDLPYFGGFQETIEALIEESKKFTN